MIINLLPNHLSTSASVSASSARGKAATEGGSEEKAAARGSKRRRRWQDEEWEQQRRGDEAAAAIVRVRFHIIRNARIENVGKSQSCMVSKLRIIWKQTVQQCMAVTAEDDKVGETGGMPNKAFASVTLVQAPRVENRILLCTSQLLDHSHSRHNSDCATAGHVQCQPPEGQQSAVLVAAGVRLGGVVFVCVSYRSF